MSPLPDPVDTIERFAELSALLDDPYAEEDETLRARGLDRAGWAAIEARWLRAIRGGEVDQEALLRYSKTYGATRAQLDGAAPSTVPDTEPDGRGFLSPDAQPWRAEAAAVGRELAEAPPRLIPPAPPTLPTGCTAVDETLDSPVVLPLPALPFERRAESSPAGTLDLPVSATRPALPFTPR
jgi:hypothetical protein